MQRPSILFVSALMVLTICTSCSWIESDKEKQQAMAKAEEFFREFSVPGPKTREVWGVTEFQVFGRYGGAGSATAERLNNEDPTAQCVAYEVTIPFWCKGTSLRGDTLKLQRQLSVKVRKLDGDGGWEVAGYQFKQDQSLTLEHQVLAWLGWSLLGIICFWPLFSESQLARSIFGLLLLFWVGGVSYNTFGTWWAVPIGIVVYAILLGLVAFLLTATLATWRARRSGLC